MSFVAYTHIFGLNTMQSLNHFLLHLAFLAASALLKLWLSISISIQIRKKGGTLTCYADGEFLSGYFSLNRDPHVPITVIAVTAQQLCQ